MILPVISSTAFRETSFPSIWGVRKKIKSIVVEHAHVLIKRIETTKGCYIMNYHYWHLYFLCAHEKTEADDQVSYLNGRLLTQFDTTVYYTRYA